MLLISVNTVYYNSNFPSVFVKIKLPKFDNGLVISKKNSKVANLRKIGFNNCDSFEFAYLITLLVIVCFGLG